MKILFNSGLAGEFTEDGKLIGGTAALISLWDDFQETGISVLTSGPTIKGLLTDQVIISKDFSVFLHELEKLGYEIADD